MNYNEAVKVYQSSPVKEVLYDVAEQLCNEMTLKEKIRLMYGHGLRVSILGALKALRFYNYTPYPAGGCKRLGIPKVLFTDGPRGIVMRNSTCFPVAMARGASFDDDLEYRVGEAMAKEAIAGGANYFAGICINLLRNPRWGRAQETYGEDQYLLGRMGVALTKAMQDYGVMACPKHYALNSIENIRFSVDVNLTDRALHEVYLPHFRKCVEAGAVSIMGAYNKFRGDHCCESKHLLKDILRDMWGFDGFTISDFVWGVRDVSKSIPAGMDIEMPFKLKSRKINKYLKEGKLNVQQINDSVKSILRGIIKVVPYLKPQSKDVIMSKDHTELAREVAHKSMVLLKNNNVLPIKNNKPNIAVVGRYADKINVGDHGSSTVYSKYTVTPYQGIKAMYGDKNVIHDNGKDINTTLEKVKNCDYIVVCIGSDHKQEGEYIINFGNNNKKKNKFVGGDRESLRINAEDVNLINSLATLNKKIIVSIMGGSAYIINEWSDKVDSIIMSFYSGLEGGNALADILSGAVNPSGKLPFTVAAKEDDYPPFLYMHDEGREINYDYYHGYALFDKSKKKVDYPFGFGLSYTEFEISDIKLKLHKDNISINVNVKNTGDCSGDEIIQVYVGSENKEQDRPIKQLKGFKRVSIQAGEKKSIEIKIPLEDIKFYDEETRTWVIDQEYTIYVGNSVADASSREITLNIK